MSQQPPAYNLQFLQQQQQLLQARSIQHSQASPVMSSSHCLDGNFARTPPFHTSNHTRSTSASSSASSASSATAATSKSKQSSPKSILSAAAHRILPTRRWSCELCRQRKVKCDGVRPVCYFCKKRNLECVYLGLPRKEEPQAIDSETLTAMTRSMSFEGGASLWSPSPPNPASYLSDFAQPTPMPRFIPEFTNIPPANVLAMNAFRVRSRFMCFPLHRRSILQSLEDIDSMNPLLLASLCAIGVEILRLGSSPELSRAYYERAREISLDALENASIETLQGLMVLAGCGLVAGNFPVLWMHSGMACRMAMLLNLEVDPDEIEQSTGTKFSWVEKETRRRLWWTIFMVDRQLSAFCHRAPNLPTNHNVKPSCNDELWDSLKDPADLESRYLNPPPNSESIGYFFISVTSIYCDIMTFMHEERKLLGINNRIPDIMTVIASVTPERTQKVAALELALDQFHGRLPPHVTIPGLTSDLLAGTAKPSAHFTINSWFFEEFCREQGPPWSLFMTHIRYHTGMIVLHRPKLAALFQAQAQKLSSLQGVAITDSTPIPPDLLNFMLTGFENLIPFARIHCSVDPPLVAPGTDPSPFLRPYLICRASAETISYLNEKLLATSKMRLREPPLFYIDSLTHASTCLILTLLHAHQQVLCAVASGRLASLKDDQGFKVLYDRYMMWLGKNMASLKDASGSMEGIAVEVLAALEQVVALLRQIDPARALSSESLDGLDDYTSEKQQEQNGDDTKPLSAALTPLASSVPVIDRTGSKSRMFLELRQNVKGMTDTLTTMIRTSSESGSRVGSPKTATPRATSSNDLPFVNDTVAVTSPVPYNALTNTGIFQTIVSQGPFVSSNTANVTNETWNSLSALFMMSAFPVELEDSKS